MNTFLDFSNFLADAFWRILIFQILCKQKKTKLVNELIEGAHNFFKVLRFFNQTLIKKYNKWRNFAQKKIILPF